MRYCWHIIEAASRDRQIHRDAIVFEHEDVLEFYQAVGDIGRIVESDEEGYTTPPVLLLCVKVNLVGS